MSISRLRSVTSLRHDGAFAAAYPENGDAPQGLVSKVRDVAVGPDGSVWVPDVWNHRFQQFAADGRAGLRRPADELAEETTPLADARQRGAQRAPD